MNAIRKINKIFKMFETCFDALYSKFRSHGEEIDFLEQLIALQLLDVAIGDGLQRVFILAAFVGKMSVLGTTDSKTKNAVFTQYRGYDSIVDVFRQCDSTNADRSLGASVACIYRNRLKPQDGG